LSHGSDKLSAAQFELIPELAGNPFLPRLFELFDHDQDGFVNQDEFNHAVDYCLRAQTPEDRMRCTPFPPHTQRARTLARTLVN
jgi:hypothetical protein